MGRPPTPTQSTTTNPATWAAHTSRQEAAGRAAELRAEIAFHDHRYYVLDARVIADEDYDRLRAELVAIEQRCPDLITADSPTQRVGEAPRARTARNPVRAIDHSRTRVTRARLLDALGIPGVGQALAATLGARFASLDQLAATDAPRLARIDCVGPAAANGIAAWFRDNRNRALLAKLAAQGATPARPPPTTREGVGLSTDTLTSNA
jgi:NAD-dependent DNA ligase